VKLLDALPVLLHAARHLLHGYAEKDREERSMDFAYTPKKSPSAGERQREGADGARVLSNFVPNSIGIDLRRGMEMTQSHINYEPAPCAYCGGRGDVDANQCRACGGQGNVLVAQPARECVHCQGRGRKSAYRCNFCQGTGWARALKLGTR
jgi:hypothetical protein